MRGGGQSLTVRSRSGTVDVEGQMTYTNTDSSVVGRVTARDSTAIDDAGQASYQSTVIAWLPLGTAVTDADQIVVANQDSFLNGTYDIDAIQYTHSHLRIFLRGQRS